MPQAGLTDHSGLNATISGSFHKHLSLIETAIRDLTAAGLNVLSPRDTRPIEEFHDFVFVAGDTSRSVRVVQDFHLSAIRVSDVLWIATEGGYVGNSTAMEIGFATALGVPVFTDSELSDGTLREYVGRVDVRMLRQHLESHYTSLSPRLPDSVTDTGPSSGS